MSLTLARALAACIYGRRAVCTYHRPERCRRIILGQICALGQSAYSVSLWPKRCMCAFGQNACSVYVWPKRCVRIVSAKTLYAFNTGQSGIGVYAYSIGQSVFSVDPWPMRSMHMLSANTLYASNTGQSDIGVYAYSIGQRAVGLFYRPQRY